MPDAPQIIEEGNSNCRIASTRKLLPCSQEQTEAVHDLTSMKTSLTA